MKRIKSLIYMLMFVMLWGVCLGMTIESYGETITIVVDVHSIIGALFMFPLLFCLGFSVGREYRKGDDKE